MLNREGKRRDIAVIGGSAGSITIIRSLLSKLPSDFPGTVGITIHRSPLVKGDMAAIFQKRSGIKVVEPDSTSTPAVRGLVYLAPSDRHMRFTGGMVTIDRGAKEHYTRPSVDSLFRSAAATYGSRVIGVLLSGGGYDGASGFIEIKTHGGLGIVQSPEEAEYPSMARSALLRDDVDGLVHCEQLADVLVALAAGEPVELEK